MFIKKLIGIFLFIVLGQTKLELVKFELPRDMSINDPDLDSWSFDGQSTDKTILCKISSDDYRFMGPLGDQSASSGNTKTLQKTFNGFHSHHWSASVQFEMYLLWYFYNYEPSSFYLDNQKQLNIKPINQFYTAYIQPSQTFVCPSANGYQEYASYLKPYFNITHTGSTLDFKIKTQFTYIWSDSSYAISEFYVYMDTCDITCDTCSGPANDQCINCPVDSVKTNNSCECITDKYSYEWTCVDSCPAGYSIQGKLCVDNCPILNCQTCVDKTCTVCDTSFKFYNGQCIEVCPFFTTDNSGICVDNMIGVYNDTTAFQYDELMQKQFQSQEVKKLGWEFSLPTFQDATYSDDGVYNQISYVGQECQGFNTMGGIGTIYKLVCADSDPSTNCYYQKTFSNLPPHYKIKLRVKIYTFDYWYNDKDAKIFVDNQQIDSFQVDTYNTNPGSVYLCGFNEGNYNNNDSIVQKQIEVNHSLSSVTLKFQFGGTYGNGNEGIGFREISLYFAGCDERCTACSTSNTCSICIGSTGLDSSRIVGSQCECPTRHIDKLHEGIQECQQCTYYACLYCQSDLTTCDKCIGTQSQNSSRIDSDCKCPSRHYDKYSVDQTEECQPCLNNANNYCNTCTTDPANECDDCVTLLRDPSNQCNCVPGYYNSSDTSVLECQECNEECYTCVSSGSCTQTCDNKCIGCKETADTCKACRGNRIFMNTNDTNDCLCPPNTSDTGLENCISCNSTCNGCLSGNLHCTGCIKSRTLDSSNPTQCQCDTTIPGIEDPLNRTDSCTTCDLVVTNIYFSDDLTSLIIEFPVEIGILGYEEQSKLQTKELCIALMDNVSYNLLGLDPKCQQNQSDLTQIIIILGKENTVVVGDDLNLKQNLIYRDTAICEYIYFQTFEGKEVRNPDNNELPLVALQFPKSKIIPCYETSIKVQEIYVDAQKGLQNQVWSLVTFNTDAANLAPHLTASAGTNEINFPAKLLQINSQYIIKFEYENFLGTSNSVQITLNTGENYGIYNEIVQDSPFELKNYEQNIFQSSMKYVNCESGTVQEEDRALNNYWEIVESDNSLTELLNIQSLDTQKSVQYTMEPYSFTAGNTYTLQFRSALIGELDINKHTATQTIFKIMFTQIQVSIEEGDKSHPYDTALQVIGNAKDIDVPEDQQQNGLVYSWQCFNLNDITKPCQTIDGTLLNVDQVSVAELNFQKKVLEPYKSFQFQFQAANAQGNYGIDKATIIIIETGLPELTVNLPQNILNTEVNKGDDLSVSINYNGNPDDVYFTLTLYYQYDVVATKRFQYTEYQFKIVDLFDNFDNIDNEVLVRVSMYDPQYFMPSMQQFTIKVNLPPSGGSIAVTQDNNIPLSGIFQINVSGFTDANLPLQYRYQFYQSQKLYEQEIIGGNSPMSKNKFVLQNFSNLPSFSTILPSAEYNSVTSKYEIFFMVSVSDARGAVFNATQIIEVQHDLSETLSDKLNRVQSNFDQIILETNYEIQLQKMIVLSVYLGKIDIYGEQNFCNNQGIYSIELIKCDCSNGYYLKDCTLEQTDINQYNDIKKLIFDQLSLIQDNITDKTMLDQIQKCQELMIQSEIEINMFNNDEMTDQLQKLEQIITEQQQELDQIIASPLWNTGDYQTTLRQTVAQDTIGTAINKLDKLQKNVNYKLFQNGRRQLQELTKDQQNTQLIKMVELQKNAQKAMQTGILPNSDEINFTGDTIQVNIGKFTQKKMEEKFFTTEVILPSFQGNNLNTNNNNQNSGTVNPNIYRTALNMQKNNPYRNEQNFPYPDQSFQLQDIDIYQKDTATNDFSQQEFQIDKPVFMQFANIKITKKFDCLQKNENDLFSNENCEAQEIEDTDTGIIDYVCKCRNINPTTIIDDLNFVFEQSQINQVFSDEGLESLDGFKFWKSIIFYTFLGFTFIYLYSLFYGYKKDKVDSIKYKNQQYIQQQEKEQEVLNDNLVDLQENKEQVKIQNQDYQQDILNSPQQLIDQQQNNSEENSNIQQKQSIMNQMSMLEQATNQKRRRRSTKKQTQNKKKQKNFNLENQNSGDLDKNQEINLKNSQNDNNDNNYLKQDSIKVSSSMKQSTSQLIKKVDLDENTKQLDIENNQIQQVDKEKQQLQDIEKKLVKKDNILQFAMSTHELFSISFIYEEKINRPSRFTLIYLKICLVLAISGTITKDLNLYYTLIWSLIGSIASNIPAGILGVLLSKGKVAKLIGAILSIIFIGTSYYIAIINAALVGVEQSNNWATAYVISLLFDELFIQFLIGYIQLAIFNYSLGLDDKNKGKKIRDILGFNLQIQQQFT